MKKNKIAGKEGLAAHCAFLQVSTRAPGYILEDCLQGVGCQAGLEPNGLKDGCRDPVSVPVPKFQSIDGTAGKSS